MLMKASWEPSGEKAGWSSSAVWWVRWVAVPPVTGTLQRSPRQEKARVWPSGERAGSSAIWTDSAKAMGVKEARARRGRVRESITGVLNDDGGRPSFCQDNGGGVEMKSVNIWAGWSVSWAMKTAILNSFLTLVWFALMPVPAAEPVQVATLPKTGETARDAAGRLVRQSTASGNQVVTRDAAGRLLVKSTRQGDATVHRDASGRLVGNTTVSGKGRETTRDASGRLQVTATVNARGDVMTYRDAAGRLMGTKTTSSGGKVVFRDASGRLTGPDFR